jgi:hypothetical protein
MTGSRLSSGETLRRYFPHQLHHEELRTINSIQKPLHCQSVRVATSNTKTTKQDYQESPVNKGEHDIEVATSNAKVWQTRVGCDKSVTNGRGGGQARKQNDFVCGIFYGSSLILKNV